MSETPRATPDADADARAIQAVFALGFLIAHRHDILPSLAAPFKKVHADSGATDREPIPAGLAKRS